MPGVRSEPPPAAIVTIPTNSTGISGARTAKPKSALMPARASTSGARHAPRAARHTLRGRSRRGGRRSRRARRRRPRPRAGTPRSPRRRARRTRRGRVPLPSPRAFGPSRPERSRAKAATAATSARTRPASSALTDARPAAPVPDVGGRGAAVVVAGAAVVVVETGVVVAVADVAVGRGRAGGHRRPGVVADRVRVHVGEQEAPARIGTAADPPRTDGRAGRVREPGRADEPDQEPSQSPS